ncbi:hypothetical protein L2E82_53284 [Cichorium intybus]|nr:hypothetical protein L2E82_53284 [Cichorium intybus]
METTSPRSILSFVLGRSDLLFDSGTCVLMPGTLATDWEKERKRERWIRPPTRCPLPFTFFAGREDANREGLPTTRSSNLAGEELKTGKKALRNRRCSQCTAIRTQTLDQAGTGDQSSIDSSISNREKKESRRGQLSSKGVAGRRLGALAGNETKASHWSTRPSAKFQLYVDKKKENPLRRGLSTIPKERGN